MPASALDAYKTTEPWSGFGEIVALTEEDEDGIGEVEGGELKVISSVYDLSGRKVNGQLPKGINIIRYSDGSTRKVVLK